MRKTENNWFVYIARCADETLYTGITTDPKRRIEEHNKDNTKGARYTKSRRPVKLVFQESFDDRASASQREYEIKQLSRIQKMNLINKLGLQLDSEEY